MIQYRCQLPFRSRYHSSHVTVVGRKWSNHHDREIQLMLPDSIIDKLCKVIKAKSARNSADLD